MKHLLKTYFNYIIVTVLLFSFSCSRTSESNFLTQEQQSQIDLEQIRERGKIIAVTNYNSTNYFIYRGKPMGYQFDMLRHLAEHLDIKLEVLVTNSLEESFQKINDGEADILAINLTKTSERKKFIHFTEPYLQTHQVLVQKKPKNHRRLTKNKLDEELIQNPLDLADKTVYVQEGSAYSQRLKNLAGEIGDTIHIIEVPEEAETLIELVAKGEIDYTVADENVALVSQTYYPSLDVSLAISFPQNIGWGIRKNAPEFENQVNDWLRKFKSTRSYALIYHKYFKNQKSDLVTSDYYAINSGQISSYDNAIKDAAKDIGWDWKLLASLIYQESRFNPTVKSWAGAFGLMQLMPTTAARFGVDESSSPLEHIYAGVRFIKWLDNQFEDVIKDSEERKKFILASYNVGLGHVLDAQRLAVKYGKDPNKWEDNVDYYLKNKSEAKYYRDPVVKYGYCRGSEPYKYVYEIMERYEHYNNILN
mgnify:CR=1 FL=1